MKSDNVDSQFQKMANQMRGQETTSPWLSLFAVVVGFLFAIFFLASLIGFALYLGAGAINEIIGEEFFLRGPGNRLPYFILALSWSIVRAGMASATALRRKNT